MQERVFMAGAARKGRKWHAICVRFNRRAKSGVREQVSAKLQPENAAGAKILSPNSTIGQGALRRPRSVKKTESRQ
jgi:hypothetical protein